VSHELEELLLRIGDVRRCHHAAALDGTLCVLQRVSAVGHACSARAATRVSQDGHKGEDATLRT
jgi:hypothetical protein